MSKPLGYCKECFNLITEADKIPGYDCWECRKCHHPNSDYDMFPLEAMHKEVNILPIDMEKFNKQNL